MGIVKSLVDTRVLIPALTPPTFADTILAQGSTNLLIASQLAHHIATAKGEQLCLGVSHRIL